MDDKLYLDIDSYELKGSALRAQLAQQTYSESLDKEAIEKTIYVNEKIFQACLVDKNPHHRDCIEGKGYLRTYHKPFFVKNPDGLGQTYHMGIVHIVNQDAEVNQEYDIDNIDEKFETRLSEALKIKRHRLTSLIVDGAYDIVATLTPQRVDFDN